MKKQPVNVDLVRALVSRSLADFLNYSSPNKPRYLRGLGSVAVNGGDIVKP